LNSAPEAPGNDPPIINIRGELVALGPLRRDLLPLYARWINDLDTVRFLGASAPMTAEQEAAWYDDTVKAAKSTYFTVYELSTLRPVGDACLMDVDHRHGTAEFGILIGEPDARGKGYGSETTRLVLRYAFDHLGLHNIELGVYEFNEAGIRAYRKAGFREVGRRREAYLHGGRRWDVIWMDCLASDFEG
jgi:RimJ/RimL family protein N-acetyltransferase